MTTDTHQPKSGDTIHFLSAGILFRRTTDAFQSDVSRRGDEITITDALLAANRDREGNFPAWLRLVADPDAQTAALGRVVAAIGPTPADLTSFDPTSSREVEDERSRRRAAAHRIHDDQERDAALRAIRRELPEPTQNTIKYREVA